MAVDPIKSSAIFTNIAKKTGQAAESLGNRIEKSSKKNNIYKFINNIEPTGGNNAYISLATLMIGMVIVPRVLTAAKRNPDDKEATKDEIKEILFRDVQTVAIVLFALKAINSIVAGKATKLKGLPMTNKAYKQVFKTKEKGLKGIGEKASEFVQQPVEKLKIIGKNILDTIHPIEGVRALTNDEYVCRYSGYNSLDEINKMFKQIPKVGGDEQKVFDDILDILIKEQHEALYGQPKKGIQGLFVKAKKTSNLDGTYIPMTQTQIANAKSILKSLEELKGKNIEALMDPETPQAVKNVVISFFQNKENAFVRKAKGLNAVLRTAALAFEAIYLGFGLPALNEKRLERKYLKNKTPINNSDNISPNTLFNRKFNSKECEIFGHFLK